MKTYLFTAAALLFATVPLQAQERHDATQSVDVRVADLDLTRSEDRSTLDRRLRAAAQGVCRDILVGSTFAWIVRTRCERETLAQARQTAALAAARAQARLRLAQATER